MSGRHRQLDYDHYVPQWGIELYRNQRLIEARMDDIMTEATEVRANVQAFITEVTARLDELSNAPVDDGSAAEAARLQEQLDAIDAEVTEAREQIAALLGNDPVPAPDPVDGPPADEPPVDDAPVDDTPAEPQPFDPNAPSRAPGF